MLRPLSLVFVALTLVAMACGFANPPPAPTPKPTVPDFPPDAVVVQVDISNFRHQDINIEVGTTVVWTNSDNTLHTIKHTPTEVGVERVFASWPIAKDEQYHFTFNEPVALRYICELHPQNMIAFITVTEKSG